MLPVLNRIKITMNNVIQYSLHKLLTVHALYIQYPGQLLKLIKADMNK